MLTHTPYISDVLYGYKRRRKPSVCFLFRDYSYCFLNLDASQCLIIISIFSNNKVVRFHRERVHFQLSLRLSIVIISTLVFSCFMALQTLINSLKTKIGNCHKTSIFEVNWIFTDASSTKIFQSKPNPICSVNGWGNQGLREKILWLRLSYIEAHTYHCKL